MSPNAAVYGRISDDREGRETGVARQVEDARALARRDGCEVADDLVFSDNDISASTRSKKQRPGFDALVEAIEAGRVGHVYAYSNSRLTRRPLELEDLIKLHERTGVVFHTVASGQDDLSTADGRMVARIKASVDAAEADRIGERVARQKRQRAERGLPQGGRYPTFGFTREWEVVEDQAEKVREAYRRRAAGEAVGSIARSLNVRQSTLGKILTNPLYAGIRTLNGEVVGPMADGFPVLVDRLTWDAAQGVREANPVPQGRSTRKYLLSGISRRDACGSAMKGAPSSARADRYRCAATCGGCGSTSVRCDWVDDPVVFAVVAKHVFEQRAGEARSAEPERDYAGAVAHAQSEIAELQAAVKAKAITLATALPMLSDAERRLREAESAQRRAAVKVADANWAYRDAVELMALPLGEMRALIARYVAGVVIEKGETRGRNAKDLSRVVIHWTDGTEERLSNGVPVVDELAQA